ncbi:hypothetical protein EVAR_44069_1 [Eumeta japonica]|uniref:Uncharacterized protein n=1 Tax=Eumeta variegata TaxID=151549 RepID=A0A4C1X2Q0_EUMVA|nr:hypothetical protein EVAR_44069_1 [Eumeta japonica]
MRINIARRAGGAARLHALSYGLQSPRGRRVYTIFLFTVEGLGPRDVYAGAVAADVVITSGSRWLVVPYEARSEWFSFENRCVRPLSLFNSDALADGVEKRSLVPRSRLHARLRRNAKMSHAFSGAVGRGRVSECIAAFSADSNEKLSNSENAYFLDASIQKVDVKQSFPPYTSRATRNFLIKGQKRRIAFRPRPTSARNIKNYPPPKQFRARLMDLQFGTRPRHGRYNDARRRPSSA